MARWLMKKIELPLIFGPRIVTMKNANQSFADFLQVVQSVVNGQRIFVSKQIFTEVWDYCVKRDCEVNPVACKKDLLIYSFESKSPKSPMHFVFFVTPNGKPKQQIELIKAKYSRLNFEGGYNTVGEKFYFQRPPEKKNEPEK